MNIKNILFSGTVVFITLEHATASTNELEIKPEDKTRAAQKVIITTTDTKPPHYFKCEFVKDDKQNDLATTYLACVQGFDPEKLSNSSDR
jgi:hypothetical protein